MKRVLMCILGVFLLLSEQSGAYASAPFISYRKQMAAVSWEELLDRYELICRQCISLKQRKDAGEAVSSRQLISLMYQLESLREELKSVSDKMPAAARRRYFLIRQMYATGEIVDTRTEMLLPLGSMFLHSRAYTEFDCPLDGVAPLPQARPERGAIKTVSATVSAPQMAYGFTAAYWGRKVGAWGSVRSNYSYHKTMYLALSDGSSGNGRIWTSGKASTDRFSCTAGPLLRIDKKIALFAGAGYGISRVCWEDFTGDWMLVKDISYTGICYEMGASVIFDPFVLSLTLSVLPKTSASANISIGFSF